MSTPSNPDDVESPDEASDSDVDIVLHARRPGAGAQEELSYSSTNGHDEITGKKKKYVMPEGMDPEYWRRFMLPGSDEEDFDEDEEELSQGLVIEAESGAVEPAHLQQRAQHPHHFCQFCNVPIPLSSGIQEHLRSYEHITITRQRFGLFCQLCPDINFPHFKSLRKHVEKSHPSEFGGGADAGRMVHGMPLLTAASPSIPGPIQPTTEADGAEEGEKQQKGHRCDPCNITLPQGTKIRHHLKLPSHIAAVNSTSCYCTLCPGLSFTSFKTLSRHRQKHANEKKIVVVDESPLVPLDSAPGHRCDACMGIIPKGAKVKSHKLSVAHQSNAAKVGLFCGLCPGKHFLTWSQLEKHGKEVHEGKGRGWKGEDYL